MCFMDSFMLGNTLKIPIKVRDNRRGRNKIKVHINGIKEKANTINSRLFKVMKKNRGMNKFKK